MPSTNVCSASLDFCSLETLEDVAFEGDAIVAVDNGADERRADVFLVQLFAAAADVGIDHLVLVTLIGAHFCEGLFVQTGAAAAARSLSLAALGRSLGSVHDEFIDNDPVQKREPCPGSSVQYLKCSSAVLPWRVDPDLGDEPFPLAVPIVNHRLGELDVGRDDQRGDVRQNVLLEKLQIVQAIGFDRRVESQAAVDELGDRLHHQFVDA